MKSLKNFLVVSFLFFVMLTGCGGSPEVPKIGPEEAAKMAFEMKQNPDAIPDVLKGNSITMDEWKALMVAISEDKEKSDVFTKELETLEGKK